MNLTASLCLFAFGLCTSWALDFAAVPATAAEPAPVRPRVLYYAGVGDAPGAVSFADFEREMLYLKESGIPVLNPAQLEGRQDNNVEPSTPLQAVLLAVADMQQKEFRTHALPLLQRCGFPYLVMTEEAAAAGGDCYRVTDDASFAHAVNFGSPAEEASVLENVKACTPAVESVPQDVVLPEFSDDDVAEEAEDEELVVVSSAEPAPAEPMPAEPAPAEPAPEEPAPAEPAPAEPAPAEPLPAEPAPEEPAPAETDAAAMDPVSVVVSCGVLGKRTPDADWVTTQFKQPLVPREQTRVSVLGYHNFSKTKPCTEMRMSTADFCRQMQFLKDSDICVISMQDFLEWRFGTRCLPERCVLITIDDGWKSVYTDAYPVLKAYGYPFTLYLYTRYINVQGDSMTTAQIQEMMANGATIGSHSSNHLYPSKWKRYKQDSPEYAAQLKKELQDSREKLISMFGNCSTYCYPGGYNTPAMHAALEEAGYQAAFTVLEAKVGCEESALTVHRYMVFGTLHEIFRRAVTFGGAEAVAATRAAIQAAEAPARAFFPQAFEGCTNRKPVAVAKKKPAKRPLRKRPAKPTTPHIVPDPAIPSQPDNSSNIH